MDTEQGEVFKNTTRGWISVVKVDRRGEPKAEPLAGGETVMLTEEEQQLTIRQHRNPAESNPFVDHDFEITDPESGAVLEAGRRPILLRVASHEPLPTAPLPTAPEETGGDGETKGQYAPTEEPGIPAS